MYYCMPKKGFLFYRSNWQGWNKFNYIKPNTDKAMLLHWGTRTSSFYLGL
jgi:hypothetical protein